MVSRTNLGPTASSGPGPDPVLHQYWLVGYKFDMYQKRIKLSISLSIQIFNPNSPDQTTTDYVNRPNPGPAVRPASGPES